MTANDVMKTGDVTKNFNETLMKSSCEYSYQRAECFFFYSFTFNSL